jgi:DNA-binding transcriptional LysR family regulator
MELRHLTHFVAVAEELSFTRAARRLHVVQSAVSASIRSLERELDAELFERTSQRVSLTGAGSALLPEARRALTAVQHARDAVEAARGTLAGTLTIGTIQSAEPLDLPAAIGRLHARHPRVTVRLRQGPAGSAVLADELLGGQLDLAFISLPGRPPAGIELRPLASSPLVAVCRDDHALAGRTHVTLPRLAQETLVDFPPGYGNRMLADRAFAAAGAQRTVAYEVGDFAAAAQLVRHGLGVALLPEFAATRFADLRMLQLRGGDLTWQLFAALPSGRGGSPAALALLEELL